MISRGAKEPNTQQQHKSWLSRLYHWLRQESLRKTVVIAILVVSLVPVVLVGAISYFRTRTQIQSLVATQLFQIANSSARQLDEFAQTRRDVLKQLSGDPAFLVTLKTSLDPNAQLSEQSTAALNLRAQLFNQAQGIGSSEPVFSQLFVLDETARLVASSDSQFVHDNFIPAQVTHLAVKPLINTTTSTSVYNPFTTTRNGLVMLISQTFKLEGSDLQYTIIGVSPTLLYSRALQQATAFLPGARALFVDADGKVMEPGKDIALAILPPNNSFTRAVKPVIQNANTPQPITFDSYDGETVLGYVQSIPAHNLSLVLQVPTRQLYGQVPLMDGSSLIMLSIMLVVLGLIAYFGTSQLVNPLLHLSDVAKRYADKNFVARANVNRKDEIGLLAGSMNKMAEELSALYADLEGQVEQRTAQLRAASEVARIATSSTRLAETLSKTVNLVNERFNLYYTAIYLTDETRHYLSLQSSSHPDASEKLKVNRRILISPSTLVGKVAATNQPHEIVDVLEANNYQSEDTLPNTRAKAAVPIAVGSVVLGVLEAHSSQPHGIDSDLLFVLQTVANQVASAIQNIRLLETTQVDLDETNLLYRITRQVTAAANEQDAVDIIIESLALLPHVSALLTLANEQLNITALYDPRTHKLERGLTTVNIPAQKMVGTLAQGNPIFVTDITLPSEFEPVLSFFQRRGCQSAAILPCMQAGKPTRIMVIGYLEGQSTSQASLQPFTNLADVIGVSLEKFRVLHSLQARLTELQLLATFSKATSAEISLSQLFVVLHQLVVETIGSNLGFIIASYNQSREMIEFPFAYEDQQILDLDPLPLGNGLTSYVIQHRQPLLLTRDTEARAQELGARIIGKAAKSWLGVPLMVGGQLTGALIIQDQNNEDRFSEDDLNLMLTLAPQIATAIRNTQLLEEMQGALKDYQQDRLFLNTWLSNTPDKITIKDINGTYIYASQSVGDQFDTVARNLIDKSDFDILPQETASRIYEMDRTVIDAGTARYGDIEQIGVDGAPMWELVSRIPIRDTAASVIGLMSIRRNVTDMKQAETFAREQAEAVRTTAEIARDAAGILDLDELLNKSVNLIRDRFNFYHASVFLLDPLGEYALLRESTGDAGRQMKLNRHRLAVGSKSIVGQATAKAEPVIIPDVTRDSTHFPNPLLPETRAEMAIPLIFGGKVLGALDVQSTQPNIFTSEDREILSILADQLAATIHNAELFSAAQGMLVKHKLLHQINVAATTASNVEESLERVASGLLVAQVANRIAIFLLNRADELVLATAAGYEKDQRPELRLAIGRGIVGASVQERRPIRVDNVLNDPRYLPVSDLTRSELALPIIFGDEMIGALNLESDEAAEFDENDQDIMAALANNLGAVVSNWRLVDKIQSQVDRQKLLFEATSKIRRSVDISTILQTSIQEIGHTMGVQRAQIRLVAPQDAAPSPVEPQSTGHNGHNGNNGHNGQQKPTQPSTGKAE